MNELKPDGGGQAFPESNTCYGGMTLRDYFAGQALVGMLASAPVADRSKPKHHGWARNAYLFADAMIVERRQPATGEPPHDGTSGRR